MREIKSFDEACQALGYSDVLPNFSNAPEKHCKALLAHYQLVIIIEAINNGWQPNWADTGERKFELWPDVVENNSKPSGFGLSSDVFVGWNTGTDVGSRLCFVSRAAAEHCFETFLPLWEDYFLIS